MATGERTLDVEAFMREVTQRGLDVKGPSGGYLYAGYQGPDGWEVIRTANNPWYCWQYNQVCTQSNGAGGNLVVTVTPAPGSVIRDMMGYLQASGTRAGKIDIANAAGALARVATVASVLGATPVLAPIGAAYTVSNAAQLVADKTLGNPGYIMGEITAAAQTETATLRMTCLCSSPIPPTVSWATSGGTPTAAAPTVNSMTLVVMP